MHAPLHPARAAPFDHLLGGLERARSAGLVYRKFELSTGLSLWVYSPGCVYEDGWDEYTMIARGLILHEAGRAVVATPFPKFFNAGDKRGNVPDMPFETFEKLEGSLIIVFHHGADGAPPQRARSIPSKRSGRRPAWTEADWTRSCLGRPILPRPFTPRTVS